MNRLLKRLLTHFGPGFFPPSAVQRAVEEVAAASAPRRFEAGAADDWVDCLRGRSRADDAVALHVAPAGECGAALRHEIILALSRTV